MVSHRNVLALALLLLPIGDHANAVKYKSFQECRGCHSDIFRLWSNSLHAKSYSNPTFKASYMTMVLDKGKETGQFCLRCHAPMAFLANDFDLKSPLAAEGVSCWFCHSISSIKSGGNIDDYYNIDTSGVIYGPYEAIDTTGHPVEYSSLHLTAEVCAGCHEFTNDNGVGILETFSEWKDSPYSKEEVYCQNCHMPIIVDMTVVDGQEVSNYYVTAHEFLGGHSKINLTHAVVLETEVSRDGDRLDVTVLITNAESGHKLPTGIPIRKLVLNVSLKTALNIEISSTRKVYRKVLTDKYGAIIENSPEMFLNATSIYSDNRIKPQETRVENFVFTLPKDIGNYKIETVLNYEYTRPLLKEELVRIQMARNVIPSRIIK